MTLQDLVRQEEKTDEFVKQAHIEIASLDRLRRMISIREICFEDENGCGTSFKSEAVYHLDEIKFVIKKSLYARINRAVREATDAYTLYCEMCRDSNLEPKKFDMNFNYTID